VPALVEGDHVEPLRQHSGQMGPRVGMGRSTVEQHDPATGSSRLPAKRVGLPPVDVDAEALSFDDLHHKVTLPGSTADCHP
jgi:hypothetical protein